MKPLPAARRPPAPRFPEDYLPYLAARAALAVGAVTGEEFDRIVDPARMV